MPDAAHPESHRRNRLFGPLDHPQLRAGDFGVIRNPRRQTRGRRFVPRRESRQARQLADFGLREIHFVERTADAELARRLPSRPVVAAIVRVVAVDDDRAARGGDARQPGVQLVLAEVTAVLRVGAVIG